MDDATTIKGKSAFELFPDIMKNMPSTARQDRATMSSVRGSETARRPASRVKPPPPPDIAILLAGERQAVARQAEASLALVLMQEGGQRALVMKALEEMGYAVETAASEDDAQGRMAADAVGIVVLEDGFVGSALATSSFHRFMKSLPMARRRFIYYVLIGPRFHTLYDLQALAESANLVVHPDHAARFAVVLRAGLRCHEELFGPYVALLQELGRR
ncbi:MAG: hypothetical protein ACOY32_05610 [Thermodesulfobacteriota bacterium]